MLNRAIKEHRPNTLIAELKAGFHTSEVNEIDALQMTALQNAAQNGMSESLLWLIASGAHIDQAVRLHLDQQNVLEQAQKTPLYLALEYSQWFNAQILLSCGADKNKAIALALHCGDDIMVERLQSLTIDKYIMQSVLSWAVFHYQVKLGFKLLKRIEKVISKESIAAPIPLRQLDGEEKEESYSLASEALIPHVVSRETVSLNDMSTVLAGLIECAMQKNIPALAAFLIRMNDGKIRSDRNIASLGFWEAKNSNHEIAAIIKNDSEQIVATLYQLNDIADNALFLKYFSAASLDQANSYLESDDELTYPDHFTPRHCKIYFAANYQLVDLIEKFSGHHSNDLLTVLDYTVLTKNYVAYASLAKSLKVDTLLAHALATDNTELLFLVMFHQNCFAYELAEKYPELSTVFLNTFIPVPVAEREGLMYRMMSHGLHGLKDTRDNKTIAFQKKFMLDNQVTQDNFFHMYFHVVYGRNDITHSQQAFQRLNQNAIYDLNLKAKRFGFDFTANISSIPMQDNSLFTRVFLTNKFGPSQLLFEMLDQKSKARLSRVSKSCYRLQSTAELDIYNHFLNSLALETKAFPFWNHRNTSALNSRKIIFMLAFIISAIGLSVSSYFIHQISNERENIENEMRDQIGCSTVLIASEDVCTDLSRSGYKDECASFCDALGTAFYTMIGSGIGCAFSALAMLIMLFEKSALEGFYEVIRAYSKGSSRFKNVSLTVFSPALQSEAVAILEALSIPVEELQPNLPIVAPQELTLSSSVNDIQTAIQTRKEAIQQARARYALFARQQDIVIEIQEEDEAEEKQGLLPRVD
ncbi:MAG: hypothetical protein P4M12_00400 [Gammaproteobacteria bacterium]|nr:hypothetical protein [Gammaproteobacteria bacterium]